MKVRGRKSLPPSEKKKKLYVFIKGKHLTAAKKEIAAIARKYNTGERGREV